MHVINTGYLNKQINNKTDGSLLSPCVEKAPDMLEHSQDLCLISIFSFT